MFELFKKKNEIIVKIEELPELKDDEILNLVEVTDKTVISRFTSVVPGAAQAIVNTATAIQGTQLANSGIYQAILPSGAKLINSKEMDGAVRGFFKAGNEIKGHANFLSVDGAVDKIAEINVANAAMGVASLVVGQYYMKQINDGLESINGSLSKLEAFQEAEYKSKVLTLCGQVKTLSDFKSEILENNEQRKEVIIRLMNLEMTCQDLLNQANIHIDKISNNKNKEFDKYVEATSELQTWLEFQKVLDEIMFRISDLNYVFHLGAMSREQSSSNYDSVYGQSLKVIGKVKKWHLEHIKSFGIDMDEARLDRKGFDAFIHKPIGLIKEDFNYKEIGKTNISNIRMQMSMNIETREHKHLDLYQDDVKMIIKDGKVFYLIA